jgi:hypothetical protein
MWQPKDIKVLWLPTAATLKYPHFSRVLFQIKITWLLPSRRNICIPYCAAPPELQIHGLFFQFDKKIL